MCSSAASVVLGTLLLVSLCSVSYTYNWETEVGTNPIMAQYFSPATDPSLVMEESA